MDRAEAALLQTDGEPGLNLWEPRPRGVDRAEAALLQTDGEPGLNLWEPRPRGDGALAGLCPYRFPTRSRRQGDGVSPLHALPLNVFA